MVASGHTPSAGEALWRLAYLVVVGIVTGLVLGKLVYIFKSWIDNAPIEITASIVVP